VPTRHYGRDRIDLNGDRLIITTPVSEMPGWDVRRYRAPVIRFDGRTWRITSKTPGPNRTTRFELEPWEPSDSEIPGPEIEYSAGSVTLRDHALELARQRSDATGLLGFAPIRSLTGFLWARMKDRLETGYGIDPVRSTKASVMIESIVTLCAFVLSSIAQMVVAFGADSGLPVALFVVVGLIAAVDAAVRWSRLVAEERPAPGFYEWLFTRRK
jgi:hypothetical protein